MQDKNDTKISSSTCDSFYSRRSRRHGIDSIDTQKIVPNGNITATTTSMNSSNRTSNTTSRTSSRQISNAKVNVDDTQTARRTRYSLRVPVICSSDNPLFSSHLNKNKTTTVVVSSKKSIPQEKGKELVKRSISLDRHSTTKKVNEKSTNSLQCYRQTRSRSVTKVTDEEKITSKIIQTEKSNKLTVDTNEIVTDKQSKNCSNCGTKVNEADFSTHLADCLDLNDSPQPGPSQSSSSYATERSWDLDDKPSFINLPEKKQPILSIKLNGSTSQKHKKSLREKVDQLIIIRPYAANCKSCKLQFYSPEDFYVHYSCYYESRLFNEKVELKFGCEFCSNRFSDEKTLHDHLLTHLDHRFVCRKCFKTAPTRKRIEKHVLKHFPDDPSNGRDSPVSIPSSSDYESEGEIVISLD